MQSVSPLMQQSFSFLRGGGEMGERVRTYLWEESGLKTPNQWPQSLRTALSMVLNSRFPMVLFWGPDLVCFYNDAFIPSLGIQGSHPSALGKKGEQLGTGIWGLIKPWLHPVFSGGETIDVANQLVPFYTNWKIEEIYWTFSFSPV